MASSGVADHTCQSVFNTSPITAYFCHLQDPFSMQYVGAGVVPVDWLFSQYFYVCDTPLCRISSSFLPIPCQPPILVLAPAPACFSACLCSRQELCPLCGCVTHRKVGRTGGGCLSWKERPVWPLWVWFALVSEAVVVEEVKQAQAVWNTQSFVATGNSL